MIYVIRNDELCHHGILGQKWGTRNGPPYPLKVGAHNAAERKAGWRSSLGGGKSPSENKKQKAKAADLKKARSSKTDQKKTDADQQNDEKKRGLSDRQKTALKVGAVAVASVLAVYGASKLYDYAEVTSTGRALTKKILAENDGNFEESFKALNGRLSTAIQEQASGKLDRSGYEQARRVYNASEQALRKSWISDMRKNSSALKDISELSGKHKLGSTSKAITKTLLSKNGGGKSEEDYEKTLKAIRSGLSKAIHEQAEGKLDNRSYERVRKIYNDAEKELGKQYRDFVRQNSATTSELRNVAKSRIAKKLRYS